MNVSAENRKVAPPMSLKFAVLGSFIVLSEGKGGRRGYRKRSQDFSRAVPSAS